MKCSCFAIAVKTVDAGGSLLEIYLACFDVGDVSLDHTDGMMAIPFDRLK